MVITVSAKVESHCIVTDLKWNAKKVEMSALYLTVHLSSTELDHLRCLHVRAIFKMLVEHH